MKPECSSPLYEVLSRGYVEVALRSSQGVEESLHRDFGFVYTGAGVGSSAGFVKMLKFRVQDLIAVWARTVFACTQ